MVKELKSTEGVSVGDIHLSSQKYCAAQLVSIIEQMLKSSEIRSYLEKLKETKVGGGYFG